MPLSANKIVPRNSQSETLLTFEFLEPDENEPEDPDQPQFGMMKFRRSGKSVNMKPEDPDNPILEVAKPTLNINGDENLEEIYSQKNGTLERNSGEGKIQPMALGPARSTSRNSFVMKLVFSQIQISFKGSMMDNIQITGFELLLIAYQHA